MSDKYSHSNYYRMALGHCGLEGPAKSTFHLQNCERPERNLWCLAGVHSFWAHGNRGDIPLMGTGLLKVCSCQQKYWSASGCAE